MKKITTTLIAVFLIHFSAQAVEGMWIPLFLSQLNESEMKSLGMQISAEDIYSVNNSSLKDAIVQFGGGCTGEIISKKGLLLTNHHCGYGQIQSHSTVQNDYLKNGFWAMNASEELRNPGLTAMFVRGIHEVTNEVLEGISLDATGKEREALIAENIKKVIENHKKKTDYDVFVRAFYYGNQFLLFETETFRDVRLVGAPPSSIGKYGSDTDNWVWPRHTGDFALFRVYANKDNKPANPADENIPYVPAQALKISTQGVKPGDFTMVFGFPGRTTQYLPSNEVRNVVELYNPANIHIRENLLSLLDKRMRASDEVRIKYAAKYARIANAWKKWIGENEGIIETKGVEKKEKLEEEFKKRVGENSAEYQSFLAMKAEYDKRIPLVQARNNYVEIAIQGVELLRSYRTLFALYKMEKDEFNEAIGKSKDRLIASMEGFAKDFEPEADREAFAVLMPIYLKSMKAEDMPNAMITLQKEINKRGAEKVAERYYSRSELLRNISDMKDFSEKDWNRFFKRLKKDPMFQLAYQLYDSFIEGVYPKLQESDAEIDRLQSIYMRALMTHFPEKRMYADANSTLRVSYGQVEGFAPRDGMKYVHRTTHTGVLQKFKPGDYEFDLPESYRKLLESEDFRNYADEDGKLPVCFIASNHTTGGNSGSPALNARGELIGLNFDRVWEGTMSDINYDISRCRNIMVDVRYILWVVDVYAGAGYLLQELELI